MRSAQKLDRLKELGALRRASAIPGGCRALGDFHDGYYECDFVSPWSISAQNVNADLALVLQDWCGSDYLSKPVRSVVRQLGHDPNLPTNKNLKTLLQETGLKIDDTFGTNAFPWIKSGAMNARLEGEALNWAFRTLVVPQLTVVRPQVAVLFGKTVHSAACHVFGLRAEKTLSAAIDNPFEHDGIWYFTVAHTGSKIHLHRGWDQSVRDWQRIAATLDSR